MGIMKNFDIRIRSGGDDAIAAVSEYVAELEGEVARLQHLVPPIAGTVDARTGMGFISSESLSCVAESVASYVSRAASVPEGFEPRAISKYGFVRPRWISVGERLPPTDEPVLACWSRQKIGMGCATFRDLFGKYCWTPADQWTECDEPIAWMPLPAPPEVQK